MTWTKLDDHLHSHPKVLAAWHANRASLGLHLLALSHSGAHLTDGHVTDVFVRAHLPSAAQRQRAIAALLDAGLWERNGSGYVIHGYLECNESREEVLARREELSKTRAQAGRKGAQAKWQTWQTDGKPMAPSRPVPSRPVPTPDPFTRARVQGPIL